LRSSGGDGEKFVQMPAQKAHLKLGHAGAFLRVAACPPVVFYLPTHDKPHSTPASRDHPGWPRRMTRFLIVDFGSQVTQLIRARRVRGGGRLFRKSCRSRRAESRLQGDEAEGGDPLRRTRIGARRAGSPRARPQLIFRIPGVPRASAICYGQMNHGGPSFGGEVEGGPRQRIRPAPDVEVQGRELPVRIRPWSMGETPIRSG